MNKIKTHNTGSTEERIKDAARAVFLKKGYSATRTRDIAEASGENLALINYYFRSKENLYRIIMLETMSAFLNTMIPVFNDNETSLDEKIEKIAENYSNLFLSRPDVPLFVLNEINRDTKKFLDHTNMKKMIMDSKFFEQLSMKMNGKNDIDPFHIFLNMMGMILFPFVASPMIKGLSDVTTKGLEEMLEERKKLIPIWVMAMIEA